MASNDDGNPAAPYFPSAEAHWREKRQALMERVADGKRAFPLGKADIAPEMDRLASEIKRLEESNHSLAATVKDFQLRLSQKKESEPKRVQAIR